MINYEDEEQKKKDLARTGLGEHGKHASVPKEQEKERKELWDIFGFNAHLSSLIALDRALPDIRHSK